jgi:hypothetical protein
VSVVVQTHPHVARRKVRIYYVYKVHAHKARLRYLGSAHTDAHGRAHAVLRLHPGRRYELKARMAGRDHVEHLSHPRRVRT